MIGIVDYQVGNIGNVTRSLSSLNKKMRILNYPDDISEEIQILILPGVGAFQTAMDALGERKWISFLRNWANDNRPLLGICLGMQLLMEESFEDGKRNGLGILKGSVEPLSISKYPHIGWNTIEWNPVNPVTEKFNRAIPDKTDFYFVHGYALKDSENELAGTRVENEIFVSAVARNKILGFQFHPERSSKCGLKLLDTAIQYLGGNINAINTSS